jgi:hypothetical protein
MEHWRQIYLKNIINKNFSTKIDVMKMREISHS